MYEEIVQKIIRTFDESLFTSSYPKFPGNGYRAYRIDSRNFREISKTNSNKKIAFVDGGNAEIIGSANFSVNLVRVCCVLYQNNKKISSKKFEALAFVEAIRQGNEIYYKASFFNEKNSIGLDEILFNSFDHTLMLGINRAEIGSVANAVRRFAELRIAKTISDNKLADAIVLDGNLQGTLVNENSYLGELYESCEKNHVILSALSKTSSVFTDNGNLLSVVLSNISSLPSWFYYPVVEINNSSHKAEIFFVKLHAASRHVFRFEIFNVQRAKADEIISELAGNCIDPVFLGYPYGLLEADGLARVSNHEKESLRTMLMVKLRNKNIEKYLSSKNAHEILDKISF